MGSRLYSPAPVEQLPLCTLGLTHTLRGPNEVNNEVNNINNYAIRAMNNSQFIPSSMSLFTTFNEQQIEALFQSYNIECIYD